MAVAERSGPALRTGTASGRRSSLEGWLHTAVIPATTRNLPNSFRAGSHYGVGAIEFARCATTFECQGLGGPLRLGTRVAQLFARRPEKGAETIVYLASSPVAAGVTGAYFFDKQPKAPPPAALDATLAQRLWATSEQLTGLGGPAATGACR